MKSKNLKLSLLTFGLFIVSQAISAQEKITDQKNKKQTFEKIFKSLDTNKDGAITLDEYKSKKKENEASVEILEKRFSRMDTNSNGSISLEEVNNWYSQKK